MRVFAVSDVHVDYAVNAQWVESLSITEFQNDVLILAGDVSDSLGKLEKCFNTLARRFMKVLFVPGNHDLWVVRDGTTLTSLQKLDAVNAIAQASGVSTQPYHRGTLSIIPMMSWYDFSFGAPSADLRERWMDFHACRWPEGFGTAEVATHFLDMNESLARQGDETIISFSHFLPRVDVMPSFIREPGRMLYPVLGANRLDEQIRRLGSAIHVYGHSHVNQRTTIDGTLYVNNAFAYPKETRIAAKALVCVHETA